MAQIYAYDCKEYKKYTYIYANALPVKPMLWSEVCSGTENLQEILNEIQSGVLGNNSIKKAIKAQQNAKIIVAKAERAFIIDIPWLQTSFGTTNPAICNHPAHKPKIIESLPSHEIKNNIVNIDNIIWKGQELQRE